MGLLRNAVAVGILGVVGLPIACSSDEDSSDPGPLCFSTAGESCFDPSDCCSGTVCTSNALGLDSECTPTCSSGADCATGCCHPLSGGEGEMICDSPEFCEAECAPTGAVCESAEQCCDGSTCVSELGVGITCRATCATHAECSTGCCFEVDGIGGSVFICGDPAYCEAPCPDTGSEPNDTSDTATVLAEIDDCNDENLIVSDQVLGADDVDWFTFFARDDALCSVAPSAAVVTDAESLRVCVYAELVSACGTISCVTGEFVTTPGALDGCCSTGQNPRVEWTTTCGVIDDWSAQVYIGVSSALESGCEPYDLEYRF